MNRKRKEAKRKRFGGIELGTFDWPATLPLGHTWNTVTVENILLKPFQPALPPSRPV